VWVGAAVNTSPTFRMRLPYLAFAIPGVVAAVVSGWSARFGWRFWRRAAVLAPVVLAGAALTAGLVSNLSVPGSAATAALQPWGSADSTATSTAALAWFVAALAWGRGVWLGAAPASFRHAARSMGLAVAGLVAVLLLAERLDDPVLRAAVRPAGPLLFVLFPLGAAVVALVHERDLERQALLQPASRPSAAWVLVLGVPMAVVGAVGLIIALLAGPVAPVIGRGVDRGATGVWSGVVAAAGAVARLFTGSNSDNGPTPPVTRPDAAPKPPKPARPPHLPVHVPQLPHIVWEGLALVAVVAGAVWFARALVPVVSRWKAPATHVDEEADSLFSWRHIGRQLWEVVRRAVNRLLRLLHLRRGADDGSKTGAASATLGPDGVDLPAVRRSYRRVLSAAAGAGVARQPSETAHEFEARLSSTVASNPAAPLHRLTALYDTARYGGASATVTEAEEGRADDDAAAVVALLDPAPDHSAPM
jgi:hypothetical protein